MLGGPHFRPERLHSIGSANRSIDWRIVHDGSPGGALKVVILAGLERPQEGGKAEQAERERQRHQIDQDFHGDPSSGRVFARSAFKVTRIDDPDMASAAIRGLANPRIAMGTATAL